MNKKIINLLWTTTLACLTAVTLQAQRPELYVQSGHSKPISEVAFSPDGKILASSSYTQIKFWDVASGKELRTLQTGSVNSGSLAFNPNGKTLAVGGNDHVIHFYDVESGHKKLETLTGHSLVVTSIVYSSDGQLLASSSLDNTVRLWHVASGKQLKSFATNSLSINSVALSPDNKLIASAGSNQSGVGVFKIWDVSSGREPYSLDGFTVGYGQYGRVSFSNRGRTLVGGGGNRIRMWDVTSGRESKTLLIYHPVYWFAFSPDEQTLAAGSSNSLTMWNTASWEERGPFKGHGCSGCAMFGSGAFSSDGKLIANTDGGAILLRDATSGNELRRLYGHAWDIRALRFSRDGRMIVSASGYGPVRLWDLNDVKTLKGSSQSNHSELVEFSNDSKIVAAKIDNDLIGFWDAGSGTRRTLQNQLAGENASLMSFEISPDRRLVVGGFSNGAIKLWELQSGKLLNLFNADGGLNAVTFHPNGQTLAAATQKNIQLLDVSSGRPLHVMRGHSADVYSLSFTPDGNTLISGSHDNTIKLWNVTSGQELSTLKGHGGRVITLAVSSDGKRLASIDWSYSLKLWDLDSRLEVRPLEGLTNNVDAVAFGPGGRILATGGTDATIKLWDLSSGRHLASLIGIDDKDWVVATPDGLFDGTPDGWRLINWRFSRALYDLAPVEIFFNEFYYPGLLSEILSGNYPAAPSSLSQKDRRQPLVALSLAHANSGSTSDRNVTVNIDISQAAAGAKDVRLFRNGLLIKSWRGDVVKGSSRAALQATFPIVAGENRLTAYAFNNDNIKSADATLTVNGAEHLQRKGVAYVLAIGVNAYANPQYNLKYAVDDAEDFAAEFSRHQTRLGHYERVELISLTDRAATKVGILNSLAALSAKLQPEDALVIFFAGHGTAQRNRFYLVPHDLGYRGRRTSITAAGLQNLLAHSISDREIERAIEAMDASLILMVIDACNSGQALEAEEKRRGPMNSKGLAQLAYEKGIYILTAAQSYQAAKETARLGHGFLTFALVEEGLKTSSADREPRDGVVLLREWLDYAAQRVPQMQQEELEEKQRQAEREAQLKRAGLLAPTSQLDHRPGAATQSKEGRQLTHGTPDTDNERRLQRPRVFYRRETEQQPLVVARP